MYEVRSFPVERHVINSSRDEIKKLTLFDFIKATQACFSIYNALDTSISVS